MIARLPRWARAALAFTLLAQFVLRADASLRAESPVWDEFLHLDYGLNFLRLGPVISPADHPYPAVALQALPLVLAEPAPEQIAGRPTLPTGEVADIRVIDDPRNLIPPRRVTLGLATLGLLIFAGLSARRFGQTTGLLVLTLGSIDPGWIAHARYLTTDTLLGTAMAVGAFALDSHRRTRSRLALGAAGVAAGLGLLAKLSAVFLVPAAFLAHCWPSAETTKPPRLWRERTWDGLRAAVAVAIVAGVIVVVAFEAHALLGRAPFGVGLRHLAAGLRRLAEVRGQEHGTFLLGAYFEGGTVLYFPVLLLAKTPVALLIAAGSSALREARLRLRGTAPLFTLPALYLAVAMASRMGLGHRHLTPVLPFVWLLASLGLQALVARLRGWGPRVAALLVVLAALESVACHPNYLPFTNVLFGGERGAHRVAVDSASDWGQALPLAGAYVAEHEGEPPHLAYFGTADPARYGLEDAVWRPCGTLGRPHTRGQPRAGCAEPASLLLISATCLQGAAALSLARDDCWRRLRDRVPDAVLGGSILVYRDVPPGARP